MEVKELKRTFDFKGEFTYKGIFRIFSKQLQNADAILDVGAGNGFLMKKIKERFGKESTGIDLNPQDDGIVKASVEEMPFEENTFDAAISTDLIEHLPDSVLDNGLKEIHRVLKPGGEVIITTLLEENLEKLACKCPSCGEVFHRIYHLQSFTKNELVERIEKTGLVVKKIKLTHFGMFSKYPTILALLNFFQIKHFLPADFKKLFKKDIIIIAQK